jgi:hypothetical protein
MNPNLAMNKVIAILIISTDVRSGRKAANVDNYAMLT